MSVPSLRRRCLNACAIAIVHAATLLSMHAESPQPPQVDPWKLKMFRFEFDNDTFLDSDDVFTAGWSFQFHSRMMDRWNPAFAGWIGRLPGLGDDGEGKRVARWAVSFSQIIITPTDLSIEEPQPD